MNITSPPVTLSDVVVTTASGAVSGQQSVAATPAGSQAAVSVQPPFTLALLNVMHSVPVVDTALDAPGQESAKTQEGTDDAGGTAPVMLLQQILDGLLAVNAVPAVPVDPAVPVNLVTDAVTSAVTPTRLDGALPSAVSVPVAGSAVQQPAAVLTESGTAVLAQPAAAKSVESLTPLSLLNVGENVAISAARPMAQAGVAGNETQAIPTTVKLDPEPSRWTQQLQSALGERLQVQVKNQIQHATIRLDPPEMGKIEIAVHIENGRMQVTINASQGEIYRALQQVSNDLRQSLTEQSFVQVDVQVSSQGGHRDGQQQPAQQEQSQDVMAAANIETDARARREDASVLLTV